jgi:hypothetical protein
MEAWMFQVMELAVRVSMRVLGQGFEDAEEVDLDRGAVFGKDLFEGRMARGDRDGSVVEGLTLGRDDGAAAAGWWF